MEEPSIPDETKVDTAISGTSSFQDNVDLSPDISYADDFEESMPDVPVVKGTSVEEEPSLIAASSIAESYGDDFEVASDSVAPLSAQNSTHPMSYRARHQHATMSVLPPQQRQRRQFHQHATRAPAVPRRRCKTGQHQ